MERHAPATAKLSRGRLSQELTKQFNGDPRVARRETAPSALPRLSSRGHFRDAVAEIDVRNIGDAGADICDAGSRSRRCSRRS